MAREFEIPAKFELQRFLGESGAGRSVLQYRKDQVLFRQGDRCDSLFYIQDGSVQLTVLSQAGKEATIALLRAGDFAGEECVSTVQPLRSASARALVACAVLRIGKAEMNRTLTQEPEMSAFFVAYLLARTNRIQADLVDQLFNSSEKRLARILLLLANFGVGDEQDALVPQINQETLAAMIGCTRSRVNFFLNRFRKLGFIDYDDRIRVNKELEAVLHD